MIAEMMADMRAEYERREEVLHREIARLVAERDAAIARVAPPPRRCAACGAAVAFLALVVAVLLPARPDIECAARLSACGDELQAMRQLMFADDFGDDEVCSVEGMGGASPMP